MADETEGTPAETPAAEPEQTPAEATPITGDVKGPEYAVKGDIDMVLAAVQAVQTALNGAIAAVSERLSKLEDEHIVTVGAVTDLLEDHRALAGDVRALAPAEPAVAVNPLDLNGLDVLCRVREHGRQTVNKAWLDQARKDGSLVGPDIQEFEQAVNNLDIYVGDR